MPNPLYDMIFGGGQAPQPSAPDPMTQLRANPLEVVRKAGYSVPDNLAGNPQAMVMHLIQSGQINSPMLQRIRPFLAQMGAQ